MEAIYKDHQSCTFVDYGTTQERILQEAYGQKHTAANANFLKYAVCDLARKFFSACCSQKKLENHKME